MFDVTRRRATVLLLLLLALSAQAATPHVHPEASHHAEVCQGHLEGAEHDEPVAHFRGCASCMTTTRLRLLAVFAPLEFVAPEVPLGPWVDECESHHASALHSMSAAPRAPPHPLFSRIRA